MPADEFEDSDVPAGPLLLPLDAWHRAKGGRMVDFAGYSMPVQYEGIMAEHLWTRTHAGLFDVSHMGQLYISGEGVEAALEAVLPIDLSTLPLGGVRYSLLLDETGGILDDLMVTRWATGFYLVVNGATKWDDIAHLREHLPDAVTINHLDESALLALQGPQVAEALAPLVEGEQPLSALSFMRGAAFKLGGVDAWISRSGYTGEDGFEISIPAESAAAVADLIAAQPQVRPIGLGARDSLRLEAGLPLYGHDMTAEMEPVEAGLAFGINKRRRTEGGFPGAERVIEALMEGPSRRRVGLAIEGRMAAREGAQVLVGETPVGIVTSGGFSPSLERPIAMAYVEAPHSAEGTRLFIDVRGRKLAATIVPMPFVPHRYHRKGAA
ncbi:glycine cleavage system aminomethyltransferase GcvT [Novosphingobium sp. KCTC 2891]|uniref:glycine cleavage system aminomethyltransferase GcvT n=1 Tax=Novosphingobium sp. KCTC 2891 TaxID=2989730 RepID=UPI0022228CA1|nr:glycine cleavage system aminomethyltransferase GcvT [Novosphingobium sp. KCTC 2891]MCW1383453.1 glycine cleavage system aminomethyltransferase GcvT [Novosphingobium sp. KCTC 2891]